MRRRTIRRHASVIALAAFGLVGCEHLSQEHVDKARTLLEACLRESWTQGEQAGKFGIACQAMNDWARQQGWHAQP